MNWQDIQVSKKILGHISSGLYRSPAGAIKELISNAFDANATRVAITTNWPSFDTIGCRDNGTGMTLEGFKQIMTGGIGDSAKRVAIDGGVEDLTSELQRPIIGWLGIGMLGIAQICHEFKVISHHAVTQTAFQATVQLIDHLKERVSRIDPNKKPEQRIDVGKFTVDKIEYDESKKGTQVIALYIRAVFLRKFRECDDGPLPSKFSAFLQNIRKKRHVAELSDYWKMVWELAITCPVPYMERGTFDWALVEADSQTREKFEELESTLRNYQFEIVIDGLSLRKPISFPYPTTRRQSSEDMTGKLFPINIDTIAYGQPLKASGYIYLQYRQAIEPMELRGLLVRIRNVAISVYDSTFFQYPTVKSPRFNWLSGEIYVKDGLEFALNVDRASFNETHEHYTKFQQEIHNAVAQVFTEADRQATQYYQATRKVEQNREQKALESFVQQKIGKDYKLIPAKDRQLPITIDSDWNQVLWNEDSPFLPKGKSKRRLAMQIVLAFETAMMYPEKERRERFYELLLKLSEF